MQYLDADSLLSVGIFSRDGAGHLSTRLHVLQHGFDTRYDLRRVSSEDFNYDNALYSHVLVLH